MHGRTDLRYDHHNHIHLEGMTSVRVDDAHQWRTHATLLLDQIADNMKVVIETIPRAGVEPVIRES